ncbi:MAG: MotA/TolQ/ExbB proton channel family protein, partial [Pseudomonas paracarnis]
NDQLKILLLRAATAARAQDEVTHRVPTPLHSRTA